MELKIKKVAKVKGDKKYYNFVLSYGNLNIVITNVFENDFQKLNTLCQLTYEKESK